MKKLKTCPLIKLKNSGDCRRMLHFRCSDKTVNKNNSSYQPIVRHFTFQQQFIISSTPVAKNKVTKAKGNYAKIFRFVDGSVGEVSRKCAIINWPLAINGVQMAKEMDNAISLILLNKVS